MNKEKHTISGRLLEVDFYPCFNSGREIPEREPKNQRTKEQQALYNQKTATKKLVRLVNANFDTGDIYLHATYSPETLRKLQIRHIVMYITISAESVITEKSINYLN